MDDVADAAGFGSLLRGLRERARVSQRSLAVRSATSQSYVARVEAGELVPSLERAGRLLGALGYALELRARPLERRSDAAGLPDQLAMSAEERLQSAANLHNTLVALRAGAE